MKKIFFVLILCFSISNGQTWQWNHPVPQGNTLNKIAFYSQWDGYAVGNSGTIMATFNQGASWNIQYEGITDNMLDLFCVDSLNVWAVGDNGTVIHTLDGGGNWSEQSLSFSNGGLNCVFFLPDGLTGWVGGDNKTLYRTINSGGLWTNLGIPSNVNISTVNSIYFSDSQNGWLIWSNSTGTGGLILHTINGGVNWTVQKTTTESGLRIKFFNSTLGIASGASGAVYRTTDGVNWNKIQTNTTYGLNDILFTSQNDITIAGDNGTIIRSSDGGATWSSESIATWVSFNGIAQFNGTKVIAGENGFLAFNSGSSWSVKQPGDSNSMNWITFSSTYPDSGIAVGQNGEFLLTTDAGKTWTKVANTITGDSFYGAAYIGNKCWAAGDLGFIAYSGNGGTNWVQQTTNTTNTLLSISFVDQNNGWAAGDNGQIIYTQNGGVNWGTRNSGTTNSIFAITFIDYLNGWYCGDMGVIGHSTNGGGNWTLQNSGVSNALFGIKFINSAIGFAAGSNGLILKTTNGGVSWISMPTNVTVNLYYISGNAGSLWAVGDAGTLLHSTDGGSTWQAQFSLTQNDLFGVYSPDGNSAYICGDYGTIISYNLNTPSAVETGARVPSSFALYPNYPNPFNPSTVINYSISKMAHIKITVYDLLGREVANLADEVKGPGNYSIRFNASGFTSGVYILRMSAGSDIAVEKMVLLK